MIAKRSHMLFSFSLGLAFSLAVQADDAPFAAEYHHYAVASDHALASKIGAQILEEGGNAADAAAATALALGVANPASSGIGGGGFVLYYRARDKSLSFLDFRERAPRKSSKDMYLHAPKTGAGPLNKASQLGGLASAVPGEAAGLHLLVKRFGSMELHQVVKPALKMAQDGAPISKKLSAALSAFSKQLSQDSVMKKWVQSTQGLQPGALLKRPELVKVLRRFAARGPAGLYRGRLGRRLRKDIRNAGGRITRRDLRSYRVIQRDPLQKIAFGLRWASAPPPSAGGFTLLQSLAILEAYGFDPKAESSRLFHVLAESWKGPFMDRQRYFGDPDFSALPLTEMMRTRRVQARASLIDAAQTKPPLAYELPLSTDPASTRAPDNAGTSHLCVVDAEGNIAALTTTVNLPFGARYTAGGVVMNDEMDDFASALGEANAFGLVGGAFNLPEPKKRPVSTMSPTIIFRDDQPVLCIGGSGGARIVTAVQQVALRVLLRGEALQHAVYAPRVHHQGLPDKLRVERFAPPDPQVQRTLEEKGHDLLAIDNVAVVQAIHIADKLYAVSDPRKGGRPAGR